MDCVSSECESSCQSDLVFVMTGGAYTGKTLPIKTKKCILAFDGIAGSTQQARCAIFRGDAGVTVRNLDSRVLVNGAVRSEHWLQMGDRIEFPNSIVLEVSQLGYTSSDSVFQPPQPTMAVSESSGSMFGTKAPSSFSWEPAFENNATESNLDNDDPAQDATSSFDREPTKDGSSNPEMSSDLLNSVETRFHEIEARLNQLADQISSLVTMASCGKLSSTAMPESDWKKQFANFSAESSSTQQSPPTHADNNQGDFIKSETLAAASRFNVADFGPEPVLSNSKSTPIKTEQNETQIELATEVVSDNDPSTLVPSRRVLNEFDSVSENGVSEIVVSEIVVSEDLSITPATPATSISGPGLSQLIESLGQSEAGEPASNEATAQQSTLESTLGGSANFSTLGTIEPKTAAPMESAASTAKASSGEAVVKPASVDDEIDAILSRLFDSKSTPSPAPLDNRAPDQSREAPSNVLETTSGLEVDSTLQVARPVDHTDSSQGSPSVPPYNELRFGYDLAANETNPGAGSQGLIVASTESEPSTESSSAQSVASSEREVAGESVMDLLARLKQDGCWDASEGDATNGQEHSDAQAEQDVTSIDKPPTNVPEIAVQLETPTAQPIAAADSVEDYMNQLLARMGGAGLDPVSEPKTKEQKAAANAKHAQSALEEAHQNSELMTAEEYVPKQKAAKIESLETMREIANNTARTAVAFSDLDRRKARGLMQCLIGVGAFVLAAYYFLFVSAALADTAFFVGTACLLITGGAGYLAFNTFKGTGILKDLFPRPKRDK